jgi:hypothetical protein
VCIYIYIYIYIYIDSILNTSSVSLLKLLFGPCVHSLDHLYRADASYGFVILYCVMSLINLSYNICALLYQSTPRRQQAKVAFS